MCWSCHFAQVFAPVGVRQEGVFIRNVVYRALVESTVPLPAPIRVSLSYAELKLSAKISSVDAVHRPAAAAEASMNDVVVEEMSDADENMDIDLGSSLRHAVLRVDQPAWDLWMNDDVSSSPINT